MGKNWIAVSAGAVVLLIGVGHLVVTAGQPGADPRSVVLIASGALLMAAGPINARQQASSTKPRLLPPPLAWFILIAAILLLALGVYMMIRNTAEVWSWLPLVVLMPFSIWVSGSHIERQRKS